MRRMITNFIFQKKFICLEYTKYITNNRLSWMNSYLTHYEDCKSVVYVWLHTWLKAIQTWNHLASMSNQEASVSHREIKRPDWKVKTPTDSDSLIQTQLS